MGHRLVTTALAVLLAGGLAACGAAADNTGSGASPAPGGGVSTAPPGLGGTVPSGPIRTLPPTGK
ncbi:MAG: hypothetical protein J2P15_17540, partial [Micromonosporaceae bacterium]|nr:hypothetical protein [Micromonosporaceae bacterium]